MQDHTYASKTNINYFTLDQQYADDIGWASTGIHILENIEKEIPKILTDRNLFINQSKTERFKISKKGNNDWKKCKYVGSLLGTKEDIARRICITNNAYSSLKTIFNNKHVCLNLKLRIFSALLESIFLYNSEVWGLDKTLEHKVDTFQRRLLRNILGIKWTKGNWISNTNLHNKTNQIEWSRKIAHRRLRFLGHVARLHENTPAKIALQEALRETKKPQGRPKTTLLSVIKKQLNSINIDNFDEAINQAQNRDNWRKLITEHVN